MLNAPDKRLALQAYDEILRLIQTGDAKPGEIVTERRLAEKLSMSRTPIRDALLILEGEGLLIRQGSRGLQIKQIRIEEYMDMLQIRLLLEPPIARMTAGKFPAENIRALRSNLNELLQSTGSETDREQVRGVDEDLHGGLAQASGNPQLAQIIQNLRRQTQIFDLRAMPERLEETCREHLRLLDAIEAGDGAEAERAMADHLERVRDSIIAKLSRRCPPCQ
jgi:DNA-binding GntR family transcriptional regulator